VATWRGERRGWRNEILNHCAARGCHYAAYGEREVSTDMNFLYLLGYPGTFIG
jgi:hypothetical protein